MQNPPQALEQRIPPTRQPQNKKAAPSALCNRPGEPDVLFARPADAHLRRLKRIAQQLGFLLMRHPEDDKIAAAGGEL